MGSLGNRLEGQSGGAGATWGGSAWPKEATCHKLSSGRKRVKSKQIREEVKDYETLYPGPWRANCVLLGPVPLWSSIFSSSKVQLYYLRAILALVSCRKGMESKFSHFVSLKWVEVGLGEKVWATENTAGPHV